MDRMVVANPHHMSAEWDAWARNGAPGEQRQEAVARMRTWLENNQPDQPLTLNDLGLTSLPEHLPANLHTLDASNNELTHLPESLPANLHTLSAGYNELTHLPENLPANLHTLDADVNQLTRLPANLPANLHTLSVSFNSLASLPENLPANLHCLSACFCFSSVNRLPENLPATLESLYASSNELWWLPENLPANLRILDVNDNQLSHLPEHLPANLHTLNVCRNELTDLPENLPANLHNLNVSCNQLSNLPENLPSTLHLLNASANQLRRLPENILTLPNTCTINIDASHLSEAVRNRLAAAMSVDGYNDVRINYAMGGQRYVPPDSLQQEVSAWTQEAGDTAPIDWSAFQAKQHAAEFAQFLGRLRETSEYLNANMQPDFQQRVGNLLRQLQDDPELQETCFNLAHDAVDTCGDRVALRMLNMETVCLDKRMETDINAGKFDLHPQAVVDYCKAQYRQQVLADAASAKIKTLNFCDEIEVILGFIVAFSREFKLNAQMDTLLYGACSNIAPEDVVETRKKLTNQAFTEETKAFYRPFFEKFTHGNPVPIDRLNALPTYQKTPSEIEQDSHSFHQFLVSSPAMMSLLKRKYTAEVSSSEGNVDLKIKEEQGKIQQQLAELDPEDPQYGKRCETLQKHYNNVPEEVNTRFRQPLLRRFCLESDVHAALQ